jgi:hypothetical protein
MNEEKQLEEQFSEYQKIAKEHKDVDVAALMINALQSGEQNKNLVSPKAKRWAYLISVGVPPIGLLLAVRYYFGDEDDGKQVAYICILLTVFAVVSFVILAKSIFSGAGVSVEQVQQIRPADIQEFVK